MSHLLFVPRGRGIGKHSYTKLCQRRALPRGEDGSRAMDEEFYILNMNEETWL